MIITLRRVGGEGWKSPYGPGGSIVSLPKRMGYLHPSAYEAIAPIAKDLVFTDVYRSPESSLLAKRKKRGVQAPGYSAHNFGLAVDLDVANTCKHLRVSKEGLDAIMDKYKWRCFRGDHLPGATESWHFTFSATGPGSAEVEAVISGLYNFALSNREAQIALGKLSLYRGEFDGYIGPLSREALRVFQRGWLLQETGKLDERTMRTLATVSATIAIAGAET